MNELGEAHLGSNGNEDSSQGKMAHADAVEICVAKRDAGNFLLLQANLKQNVLYLAPGGAGVANIDWWKTLGETTRATDPVEVVYICSVRRQSGVMEWIWEKLLNPTSNPFVVSN